MGELADAVQARSEEKTHVFVQFHWQPCLGLAREGRLG